jgi:hypothetical protein
MTPTLSASLRSWSPEFEVLVVASPGPLSKTEVSMAE